MIQRETEGENGMPRRGFWRWVHDRRGQRGDQGHPRVLLAAGVPCRVIRKITEADSMVNMPEVLADNQVLEEEKE